MNTYPTLLKTRLAAKASASTGSYSRRTRAAALLTFRTDVTSPTEHVIRAFECLNYCCIEIAWRQGIDIQSYDHPDGYIIVTALRTSKMSETDVDHAIALLEWLIYPITMTVPPLLPDKAWGLAERIFAVMNSR